MEPNGTSFVEWPLPYLSRYFGPQQPGVSNDSYILHITHSLLQCHRKNVGSGLMLCTEGQGIQDIAMVRNPRYCSRGILI